MPARVMRVVVAGGLAANAVLVPHPLGIAAAQAVLAIVVVSGVGGAAVLAAGALLFLPLPVAELRRALSHVPLACPCLRSSGRRGVWPAVGAVADVGLVAVTVWLARARGSVGRRRVCPGTEPGSEDSNGDHRLHPDVRAGGPETARP